MSGKRGPSESSFGPTSGFDALQVDVIGDQHQAAALQRQVDAAGGVGEHHGAHARAMPARARRRSPAPACSLRRDARARPSPRRPDRPACRRPACRRGRRRSNAGQPGISAYGISTRSASSSANAPRPLPSTTATRGRSARAALDVSYSASCDHSSIPAMQADMKLAMVPAATAFSPRRARSDLRVGASAPMPPI